MTHAKMNILGWSFGLTNSNEEEEEAEDASSVARCKKYNL
jgi:hypothetical protein